MSAPARKCCLVVYATPEREYTWTVTLAPEATIGAALAAARAQAGADGTGIPWATAPVGVFGERRTRGDPCLDGERIELYRPLRRDPREGRRERIARERRAARR